MAKNDYAKRLIEQRELHNYFVKAWTIQMCLDVMVSVLNDPDVMGKDVIGAKRLARISNAFNERFPEFVKALTADSDADWRRQRIDDMMVQIFGENAATWEQRYDGWTENSRKAVKKR
jgi:hypothetical protein